MVPQWLWIFTGIFMLRLYYSLQPVPDHDVFDLLKGQNIVFFLVRLHLAYQNVIAELNGNILLRSEMCCRRSHPETVQFQTLEWNWVFFSDFFFLSNDIYTDSTDSMNNLSEK